MCLLLANPGALSDQRLSAGSAQSQVAGIPPGFPQISSRGLVFTPGSLLGFPPYFPPYTPYSRHIYRQCHLPYLVIDLVLEVETSIYTAAALYSLRSRRRHSRPHYSCISF